MSLFSRTCAGGRSFVPALFLVLPILSLVGCGGAPKGKASNNAAVEGTVTYRGGPVTGGKLMLYLANNPNVYTPVTIDKDGKFKITDLTPGNYIVTVNTAAIQNAPKPYPPLPGAPPSPPLAVPDPGKYMEIPRKYLTKETSGITWELKPGEQTQTVTLTD